MQVYIGMVRNIKQLRISIIANEDKIPNKYPTFWHDKCVCVLPIVGRTAIILLCLETRSRDIETATTAVGVGAV